MAKAKTERKTMSYEIEGTVLTISSGDEIVAEFDKSELPNHILVRMGDLGFKTKIANFAASLPDSADKLAAQKEGWEMLVAGRWEKEREGGGPTVSPQVEALAQLKGVSVSAIQKKLREYTDDQRVQILSNKKVVKLADEIRSKRESSTVFLTDLLDEMTN